MAMGLSGPPVPGDAQPAGTVRASRARGALTVGPILHDHVDEVCCFLEQNMSSGVTATTWAQALRSPWAATGPDHGVLMRDGDRLVGVYVVFHSRRTIDGVDRLVANLGAWCVLPEHRSSSFRMLRSVLARKGCVFTDLSPSGNVVALNRRLGFVDLDTTTDLVLNLPWPVGPRGARLVTGESQVEMLLDDDLRQVHRDHAASRAVYRIALSRGGRNCYVIYRRDRRKRLPLFVTVLHVSDPELFAQCSRLFARHALLKHGALFSLMERRVVGRARWPSRTMASPRPRMFRGDVSAEQVDYLYSELTAVPW